MSMTRVVSAMLFAALASGCGGADEPAEEAPMRVEDTAFGPLVGTPQKVQDRTDAAADLYRDKMNERLEADEGGGAEDEQPSGD